MPSPTNSFEQGLCCVAITDVGLRRPINQDSHSEQIASAEQWQQRGHLFIVADGMGAHAAGELASQQAVDELVRHYQPGTGISPQEALRSAFETANDTIHRRGREHTDLYNMGTTCSALVLLPEGAFIAHVGDSRVYCCRNEKIQQLTFDHSLVWEMRAAGQLSKRDAQNSIVPRNVITRCLGPHPAVQVDLEGPFTIQESDVFLLCSDGLTGRISDAEIGAILSHFEPTAAARFLVTLANLRGGTDNITVIVIKIVGPALVTSRERHDLRHQTTSVSRARGDSSAAGWFVLGLASLVVMAAASWELWWVMGLAALAGIAAAASIAIPKIRGRVQANTSFGEAPYETTNCPVDDAFVASILETLDTVLDRLSLSTEQRMPIQDKLDGLTADAESGSLSRVGDRLFESAEQVLQAVRDNPTSVSDSSVELS